MTLEQLQARLDAYLAAEARILNSQEYQIGQGSTARKNRRAELEQVQAGIREARAELASAQNTVAGVRRLRYIRPRC